MRKKTCSSCENEIEKDRLSYSRYCRKCANDYHNKNRKKHSELSEEEKLKANARSYTNQYIKRGYIFKEPCYYCGNPKVQVHHPDYTKPLIIYWLCIPCHRELHSNEALKNLIHSVSPTPIKPY